MTPHEPAPRLDPARVEDLFRAALPLSPEKRRSFFAQVAGGDTALQREVTSLLEAHDRGSRTSAESPAPQEPAGAAGRVGRRLGPFTLRRLLAEDAMGAVYEAEQDQPHRLVAFKMLRVPSGLARFEREAETMHCLHHPGIAQVFAAGTIEEPGGALAWFAMELVPDTRNILEHAAENELDLPARLALFDELCRAVGHGHRHGVQHHDLKPDNVRIDGEGRVRVIDFGVTRVTGSDAAEVARRGLDLPGTLAYLSPEQCAGGDEGLDARSDVYSLGVLLYELVTGKHPHALDGKGPTEILDFIRNQPPTPPSVQRPDLPRELQTILLVALEKDRERRYATVETLVKDLQRFLAAEPLPVPPTESPRSLLRFARRHRSLVAAGALVLLVLVAAVAVSSGFGLRAMRTAERETDARVHAERVAQFLETLFTSARPSTIADANVRVRDVLDNAVAKAEAQLSEDPEVHGDVLATLGITYAQLAAYDEGAETLERALALGARADDPVRRADLLSWRGFVALHRGQFDAAQDRLDESLALLASLASRDISVHVRALRHRAELERRTNRAAACRATLQEALELADPGTETEAQVHEGLGTLAAYERDFAEAKEHFAHVFELRARLVPADHMSLGVAHDNLANVLFRTGDVPGAELHWNAALTILEATGGADHPDVAAVAGHLALVHQRRGEYEPAERNYRRALNAHKRRFGDSHPRVASTLKNLGWMFFEKGDLARAAETLIEAANVQRRALEQTGQESIDLTLAEITGTLGHVFHRQGMFKEAMVALRASLKMKRELLPEGHPELAGPLTLLGQVLLDGGQAEEARTVLEEAYDIRLVHLPDHWLTANTASILGESLAACGELERGRTLTQSAIAPLREALGSRDFRTVDAIERAIRVAEDADEDAAELRAMLPEPADG